MNHWLFATVVVLSPTMLFANEVDPPADKSAITVSIAIPVHGEQRPLNKNEHFHVLVTNTSDKPLRLWTDRFSWGYDNLSFEQTLFSNVNAAIPRRVGNTSAIRVQIVFETVNDGAVKRNRRRIVETV